MTSRRAGSCISRRRNVAVRFKPCGLCKSTEVKLLGISKIPVCKTCFKQHKVVPLAKEIVDVETKKAKA